MIRSSCATARCLLVVLAACDTDTLTICHSEVPLGTTVAAIVGGQGSADHLALDFLEESSVVPLRDRAGAGHVVCSGVMISRTFALSAAHCVGALGSIITLGAG